MEREVKEQRKYNTRVVQTDDGRQIHRIHTNPIFYDNKLGLGDGRAGFRTLDQTLAWIPERRGWGFIFSNFHPLIPEYADEAIEFRDLMGEKDQWVSFEAIDAAHVKGRLVSSVTGLTDMSAVVYDDAFGTGIDLIVYTRWKGLAKVVRIRDGFKPSKDISFDFEVDFSEPAPTEPKLITKTGETKITDSVKIDVNDRLLVGKYDKQTSLNKATFIRPARVWDGGTTGKQNQGKLVELASTNLIKQGDIWILRKTFTADFLSRSVGDVFTDALITITEDKDTYYGTVFTEDGNPDGATLNVGGWGDFYYSYVEWDLTGSPSSARTTKCDVKIKVAGVAVNDSSSSWRRITESWVEADVSETNNPASTATGEVLITNPVTTGVGNWDTKDITTFYKDWKDAVNPNYGLKIHSTGNNNAAHSFHSSDAASSDDHPILEVTTIAVIVTKSLAYYVRTTPTAPTKSLRYFLVGETDTQLVTKSLKYCVPVTKPAITKGLRYGISISGGPTAITPLVSQSNVQQSTTSLAPVNSDVVIAGASLESGKKYLVLYHAVLGGSSTAIEMQGQVSHGSTDYGKTVYEGSSSGTPATIRGGTLQGFCIITGDGSSDLRIRYGLNNGSGTVYIGAKMLIAIPLNDVVEDTDYFQAANANGDADIVTNVAADPTYTSLLSMTKTFDNGDYLVLMSGELAPDSVSVSGRMRFKVGGVVQKIINDTEGEATTGKHYTNFSYAKVHTLNGSTTLEIDVASESGSATDARRGRIIVLKLASFDQHQTTSNNVADTVISQTNKDFITRAYTPNQQEYVLVIGNAVMWQSNNFRSVLMHLRNDTDATDFPTGAGSDDEIAFDDPDNTTGRFGMSVFATEQISVLKSYKLQFACENPSGTGNIDEGDLVVLGLTVGGSDTVIQTNIQKSLRYEVTGISEVAITKSLTYTITADVAITKSLKYAVTDGVAITKSLHYEILTAQNVTKSLQYLVETAQSITKNLEYAVITIPSAVTKSLRYAIETIPAITKFLKYVVESAQSVTKSLQYTVITTPPATTKSLQYATETTPSAITKSLHYEVTSEQAVTKSLHYEVTSEQSVTKSLKYTTTSTPSAITKALQYVIPSDQTIQKSLRYLVKTVPSITKTLEYAITTTPAITKSLQYEVVSPVGITKSLKYATISTPSSLTKTLKYAVIITPSAIAKALQYEVVLPVGITKSLKYAIVDSPSALTKSLKYVVVVTPTALSKSLTYTIITTPPAIAKSLQYSTGGVTIQKPLEYAVIISQTINKSLTYSALVDVAIQKSLTYTVIVTPSAITKSLSYSIARELAISKPLQYAVFLEQAITKSLKYVVLSEQSITRTLSYAVATATSITKSCTYSVLTTVGATTKSLQYVVVTTASALQKSLAYAIKKSNAVTKSLTYEIVKKITKSLRYTILVTSAITKSQTYHTLVSTAIQKSLAYEMVVAGAIQKSLVYRIIVPSVIIVSVELLKFEVNVSVNTAREDLNLEPAKREVNLKGSSNNINL